MKTKHFGAHDDREQMTAPVEIKVAGIKLAEIKPSGIELVETELAESELVQALSSPSAYADEKCSAVVVIETHISYIFLTDNHAYKVKKRLKTDFLDYTSLPKRRHYCFEEFRLNRRYAPALYVDVVPITTDGQSIQVEGTGRVVEYAVKMRRFPDGSLLKDRLATKGVSDADIDAIASCIATFHKNARSAVSGSDFGAPAKIRADAMSNLEALARAGLSVTFSQDLDRLKAWTERQFQKLQPLFLHRQSLGFVRECHGDLHAGNIVKWGEAWLPFDGIEFNQNFRWIDVLSDAAFLASDLAAEGHRESANRFRNRYLEEMGHYCHLQVLRWYMVYRTLVRAKVDAIRMQQLESRSHEYDVSLADLQHHLTEANRLTEAEPPRLWITHGLSGSGKSSGALQYVEQHGAIRLRSDVIRKTLFDPDANHSTTDQLQEYGRLEHTYSPNRMNQVYCRMRELAREILVSGFSVIVDATFLKLENRAAFAELASDLGVEFQILDFQSPESKLRSRILARQREGNDPSEAGVDVLEFQLEHQELLTAHEQTQAIRVVSG